jgi:hypothetical protein
MTHYFKVTELVIIVYRVCIKYALILKNNEHNMVPMSKNSVYWEVLTTNRMEAYT